MRDLLGQLHQITNRFWGGVAHSHQYIHFLFVVWVNPLVNLVKPSRRLFRIHSRKFSRDQLNWFIIAARVMARNPQPNWAGVQRCTASFLFVVAVISFDIGNHRAAEHWHEATDGLGRNNVGFKDRLRFICGMVRDRLAEQSTCTMSGWSPIHPHRE